MTYVNAIAMLQIFLEINYNYFGRIFLLYGISPKIHVSKKKMKNAVKINNYMAPGEGMSQAIKGNYIVYIVF